MTLSLRFDSGLESAWRIVDQFDMPDDERLLGIENGEHMLGTSYTAKGKT